MGHNCTYRAVMLHCINPSNSWTIGPKHSNGSCRALKIYHVNIAAAYAFSHPRLRGFVCNSRINRPDSCTPDGMLCQALYMLSKNIFSGFALKPMIITYSCKTLPCLTKIFACSEFPKESHHFMFVKQQRAFFKLLGYKSAPEIIELYLAKCWSTLPSKPLSLMLARTVLFWIHMYISTFIDWWAFWKA